MPRVERERKGGESGEVTKGDYNAQGGQRGPEKSKARVPLAVFPTFSPEQAPHPRSVSFPSGLAVPSCISLFCQPFTIS